VTTPVVCDDKDACTIDSCDPLIGCVHTPLASNACDDRSVCTTDFCDTTLGCVNQPIPCNSTDPCLTNNCDSILGCQTNAIDCSQIVDKFKQGDCQLAICDPASGCILQPIPGATLDACGFCTQAGQAPPFCFLGLGVGAVAGLSAGIIAAIVIAAIAVAVIMAVSAAAGYAVYAKAHKGMNGAQTNAIYTGNGMGGSSPIFKS
jgi:hypothetical protein